MNALVIVDVQNDFCPGGALAVQEGDRLVPLINRIQAGFGLVVATQDWHPANHGSFATNHPGRRPGEQIEQACRGVDLHVGDVRRAMEQLRQHAVTLVAIDDLA